MNIFTLLSYLNKISFFAFIITFVFLGYQLYMLKKESSLKQKDISNLPNFNENESPDILNYTKLNIANFSQDDKKTIIVRKDNRIILSGIFALFFLLLTVIIFFNLNQKENTPTNQSSFRVLSPSPEEKRDSEIIVNNQITPTLKPSPTKVEPSLIPSPSPTEVLLSYASPTSSDEKGITITLSPTLSKIEKLPLTSFFNGTFLFFSLAFLFIFSGFIF